MYLKEKTSNNSENWHEIVEGHFEAPLAHNWISKLMIMNIVNLSNKLTFEIHLFLSLKKLQFLKSRKFIYNVTFLSTIIIL